MNLKPAGTSALGIALLVMALPGSAVRAQETAADSPPDIDSQLRSVLLEAVEQAESFEDKFDAQVWLTDMSRRVARQLPDPDERLKILQIVHQHATQADISPELVLAVIDVESNFDRYAISSAHALGLMQVMPFWVDELEIGDGNFNILFDIEYNILIGVRILKYYLDMEQGDLVKGLARYNGSAGRRVYSDKVIQRLQSKWFQG